MQTIKFPSGFARGLTNFGISVANRAVLEGKGSATGESSGKTLTQFRHPMNTMWDKDADEGEPIQGDMFLAPNK